MPRISQREARRLRKEVVQLREIEDKRRRSWSADYPGGVNLVNVVVQPDVHAIIKTARKLGHAVVVTNYGDNTAQFYALPHPSASPVTSVTK